MDIKCYRYNVMYQYMALYELTSLNAGHRAIAPQGRIPGLCEYVAWHLSRPLDSLVMGSL